MTGREYAVVSKTPVTTTRNLKWISIDVEWLEEIECSEPSSFGSLLLLSRELFKSAR